MARLVPSLTPADKVSGVPCQALIANDATIDLFGKPTTFAGEEASLCYPSSGPDQDVPFYVEWHGKVRAEGRRITAAASITVGLDLKGQPTEVDGTIQADNMSFDITPVSDGRYAVAEQATDSGAGKDGSITPTSSTDPTAPPTTSLARPVPAPPDMTPGAPSSGPDPAPPPDTTPLPGASQSVADGPSQIDGGLPRPGGAPGLRYVTVMFGYANDMTATQAQNYMQASVQQANDAFTNSGMPVRVASAGPAFATGFTPETDAAQGIDKDLSDMGDATDGKLDNLVSAWQQSNGDTVVLLVNNASLVVGSNPPAGTCGRGALDVRVDGPDPWSSTNPAGLAVVAMNGPLGTNLICQYSFTHELGHNLGAQHNPESAGNVYPLFPWGYGHWVSGVGSTIMTYTDVCGSSGCPRKLQFSDPNAYFLGSATEKAGTPLRNNMRNITDMSWGVVSYAGTGSNDSIWYGNATGHSSYVVNGTTGNDMEGPYIPVAGDFNGDGRTDQFWYFPGVPKEHLWTFNAASGSYSNTDKQVDGNYKPVVGDFDGDGRADIFWHSAGSDPNIVWWGTANPADFGTVTSSVSLSGNYTPVAGDIDGDHRSDLVLYGPGATADSVWWGDANRATFASGATSTSISVGGVYTPVFGDLNGDGYDDLLWYSKTATSFIWHGGASRAAFGPGAQTYFTAPGSAFVPLAGDFNKDGRDDIFWYEPGTGADYLWSGQPTFAGFVSPVSTPETVNGYFSPTTGDFNGDGFADIFWFAFG